MKIVLNQLELTSWSEDLTEIISEMAGLNRESWMANENSIQFDWADVVFNTDQSLIDEYCAFIMSSREQLGKPELELLAFAYGIKINLFRGDSTNLGHHQQYESNSDQLKLIEKIIPDCGIKSERFILMYNDQDDDDKCYWKRLNLDKSLKEKMETFYKQRSKIGRACKLLREKKINNITIEVINDPFQFLIQLVRESDSTSRHLIKDVKKLNPEFGVPRELSEQLYFALASKRDTDNLKEFYDSGAMSYLVEKIIECVVTDGDLVFYLHIINHFPIEHWRNEFFLLEIENRLQRSLPLKSKERDNWRRLLRNFDAKMFTVFRQFLSVMNHSIVPGHGVSQVLKMIESGLLDLTKEDMKRLEQLSLSDLLLELKMIFWKNKMKIAFKPFLGYNNVEDDENKSFEEALYCLLELNNLKGDELCNQLLNECEISCHPMTWDDLALRCQKYDDDSSASEVAARSAEEIGQLILKDSNTSETIKNIFSCDEGNRFGLKLLIPITEDKIKEWLKRNRLPNKFSIQKNLNEFLDVFDWFIKCKLGYTLRETQRVTIKGLLGSDYSESKTSKNRLVQVSTGEGKSIIVVACSIALALSGHTVDVITSNTVLAIRDSTDKNAEIYAAFGVSVGNNCSQTVKQHRDAYSNCAVVYGELSNFQGDHLQDQFYNLHSSSSSLIRGERKFDCVIVDEVDW
jgi:hypothetical protein